MKLIFKAIVEVYYMVHVVNNDKKMLILEEQASNGEKECPKQSSGRCDCACKGRVLGYRFSAVSGSSKSSLLPIQQRITALLCSQAC